MSKRAIRSTTTKGLKSTFTYYIPAPPNRKSGYREKEFDKIITGILSSGFIIESLQTQAVGHEGSSGLFVLIVLKAPNAKVAKLDALQDIQEKFKLSSSHSSPDIILEDDEFSDDI